MASQEKLLRKNNLQTKLLQIWGTEQAQGARRGDGKRTRGGVGGQDQDLLSPLDSSLVWGPREGAALY